MQKKLIKKKYEEYLSVNEINLNKWSKDFFLNFFLHEGTIFFSSKIPSHGYLIARKVADEFEVISLVTNTYKRRNGIASKLLSCLIKKAEREKIKRILLEVSVNNLPAIMMYKKFGFYKTGNRKKYYNTKEGISDALTMEKLIN